MVWVEVDTGVEIVTTRGRTGPQMETVNEHRHENHQMIITTKIVTGIVKDGCHQGVNFVSLPYV
jgi:phosphoribosylformimino-5-aminoimidazole carboxamide ribonucleotide (ProFAR) isomerase